MIGETISHYKIINKLGEGGMGVVYKAHDTRLDRVVALKFLPHYLAGRETDKARFLQEAKAASALNHPNVCTIYGIEEHEGQPFIEMEYVDGVTLKRKFSEHPLTIPEALRYAIFIGEALQEAHAKEIVHRDVKSENIMVTSKDQVKVMDFGLAKLKGSVKLTKSSATTGTLAYMAPEQIQGQPVDARADIFSFGVVLYEMLTGHMPFRGEHEAAMVYSIVHEEPQPIQKYRNDIPPELVLIIGTALNKNLHQRYQSMAECLLELRRVSTAGAPLSTLRASPGRRRVVSLMITGAVVLLAGSYLLTRSPRPPEASVKTIAVLPLANMSSNPDDEYFSDGMTEDIITQLTKIGDLKVISRTSVMQFKRTQKTIQEIGKELHADVVLEGSVRRAGDQVRITAQLIDANSDEHLWAESYDRSYRQVFAIQTEIATVIASKLHARLTATESKRMARSPTSNPDAYTDYLKGRYFWNKRSLEGIRKGITFFEQAVEKDSNYALAYSGLVDSYLLLCWFEYSAVAVNDVLPKALAAATRAVEIDPDLAEAHTSLAMAHRFSQNWPAAESEFRRALELNPNYATAHQWHSESTMSQGRMEESIAEMRNALALDPLSLIITRDVGWMLYFARRYDEAMVYFQRSLEMDPNFMRGHLILGEAYVQQGKFDAAVREFETVNRLSDGPVGDIMLAYTYAKMKRNGDALRMLSGLRAKSRTQYVPASGFAIIFAALGQMDEAFRWLDQSNEEKCSNLLYLKVDPLFDDFRSDRRFDDILKKTGLTN